jgi:hypothetical protein
MGRNNSCRDYLLLWHKLCHRQYHIIQPVNPVLSHCSPVLSHCSPVHVITKSLCNINFKSVRIFEYFRCNRKVKGRAVFFTGLDRPIRFQEFDALWISRQSSHDSDKIVSSTHWPPLPQKIPLVLISVRGWVNPRAIVRPEGLCEWKNPVAPSRMKPVTFRLPRQYAFYIKLFLMRVKGS